MNHNRIRQQFGRAAEKYATSVPHAKGHTLHRLIELLQPRPEWHALDIATGAGHVAFALAPTVSHVTASDITPEMLTVTQNGAIERNFNNITTKIADAAALPFDDNQFDAVTCRIAPHHFPDTYKFLLETNRVLKPDGVFGLVDNTVPDGDAGDYINAFEKLRDPSHNRCLTDEAWEQDLYAAGFNLTHKESMTFPMEFASWTSRMDVSPDNVTRLHAMLVQAPDEVAAVLTPSFNGIKITFHLHRTLLIAIRR